MKKFKTALLALFFCAIGISAQGLNSDTNLQYYSQASQDHFVHILLYKMLGKQDVGHYLEIGAQHPIVINNTYFFEKNFGWQGVSIDISEQNVAPWNSARHNRLLINDATKVDYTALLLPYPHVIDYLSLDIDGNYDTVLQRIPLDSYTFKIITIEHDYYRYGDKFRKNEREILSSHGYLLLCSDVSNGGAVFEDWWIHPSAFPERVLSLLKSVDLNRKEYRQLITTFNSLVN